MELRLAGSAKMGLGRAFRSLAGVDVDPTMDRYTLAAASKAPVSEVFTLAARRRSAAPAFAIPALAR